MPPDEPSSPGKDLDGVGPLLLRILARLALGALGVTAVLGTAELIARSVWEEPYAAALPPDPDLPTLLDRQLDHKNLSGIHRGVYFRTNSRRIRGPEYSPEPPPGVIRILIVGDSVTMGWGVNEADTYSARLEALLNAESTAGSYEVLNGGLAGLNIGQVMRRLGPRVRNYHPDLIVYGFTSNDIEGPAYRKLGPDDAHTRGAWRRLLSYR